MNLARRLLPFDDASRRRRLAKVGGWLAAVAAVVLVLHVLGVDVREWLAELRHALSEVSVGYLVAGLALQTVQTALAAVAWLFVLRAAYPQAVIPYRSILAAYAAGAAMSGFLPANVGTVVTLLMFAALIAGATVPGLVGAAVVQKIFFTVASVAVYLYLFLTVPGSFSLQLGWFEAHRAAAPLLIAVGAILVAVLVRVFWPSLRGLWKKTAQGGAILGAPRAYFVRVFLPSFGSWLAKLGVIAVFLAAYGIPVTFHTVMSIVGGNSLANTVSATPGGVGVNQAINVASLREVTDAETAVAYSIGQHLIVSVWKVALALVLVVWAFGWTGGKHLLQTSYADAKVNLAEQRAERAARRARRLRVGGSVLRGRRRARGEQGAP